MRRTISILLLAAAMATFSGCPPKPQGTDLSEFLLITSLLGSHPTATGSPCGYTSSTGLVYATGLATASTSWQTLTYERDLNTYWNVVTKVTGIAAGDKIIWKGSNVDAHTSPFAAETSVTCPIDTSLPNATGLANWYDDTNHYRSLVAGSSPSNSFAVVIG